MTNGNSEIALIGGEKAVEGRSVQTRFQAPYSDEQTAGLLFRFAQASTVVPEWGGPGRDPELRKLFYAEGNDMVQSAASSFIKKMNGLRWLIEGPERAAANAQNILNPGAEMGQGWLRWLAKSVMDYLSQDAGSYDEIVRDATGRIVSIAHLDSAMCRSTNDPEYPVIYTDMKGEVHRLRYDQVMHIVDLPSPQEGSYSNIGFCAMSRIVKSARIIQQMAQYKDEKLGTRPVPGIAMAKGVTLDMVRDALQEADEEEVARHGRLLYRNIPIMAALSPDYEMGFEFIEFRSMPDGFNVKEETELFVFLLALAFGVDPREFWPGTTSGATKADALVQAMKARGKGPGELINQYEFQLNTKVMPASCRFRFDHQDDEEDERKAEIRKTKAEVIRSFWEPSQMTGEGIITGVEARNWAVDMDVLPDWMRIAEAPEEVVEDLEPEGPEGEEQVTEDLEKAVKWW